MSGANADRASLIDEIEADRRKREREALAILLLLFAHAREDAQIAAQPLLAIRRVLLGDDAGLTGLAAPLAERMAEAYGDGLERAAQLAGVTAGAVDVSPTRFMSAAEVVAADLYRSAAKRFDQALTATATATATAAATDATGGGIESLDADQIAAALDADGYGADDPYMLRTIAETQTVTAYNRGLFDGYGEAGNLTGFEFVNPRDERTSAICWSCVGTRLAIDDPWWLTHWPPLHFNCRSIPFPIIGEFTPTTAPEVQPMAGFGEIGAPPVSPVSPGRRAA